MSASLRATGRSSPAPGAAPAHLVAVVLLVALLFVLRSSVALSAAAQDPSLPVAAQQPSQPAAAQQPSPTAAPTTPPGMRAVEDPLYGVRSVVPETWTALGGGIHARGTPPQDPVLIAIQSAPVPLARLWPALLPQLALADIPEPVDRRSTAHLDWTLYRIEVATGAGLLTVHLALAERDGASYLVLLQSKASESETLYGSVFLPAVDAFATLAPEPTPDPASLPYLAEEVTFPGGSPGVTLAGTLTRPRQPAPVAAVVLMSGSGPQDRDESLAPVTALKPFALIADALSRAGIAVLRYDDRGVGGSTGDHDTATLSDLTEDARSALAFLAGHPGIDPAHIGLLGHSEGGIYAAALAADDPRVAFVVGLAPPATDGVSLLVAQYESVARAEGASDEEVEASRLFAEEAFPAASEGDLARVEAAIRDAAAAAWDRQDEETRALLGEREAYVRAQVSAQLPYITSAWFRSLLAADPGDDWRRVRVPVLGLFGGLDVQVVAAQNEPALVEALEAADNIDYRTIVLPDANHLFQAAVTGAPSEYGSLEPAFTPDLLPQLVDWVVEHAGLGAG